MGAHNVFVQLEDAEWETFRKLAGITDENQPDSHARSAQFGYEIFSTGLALWDKGLRPSESLLSEAELEAMSMTGALARQIRKVIGTGPQSEHDWAEMARMIHDIQHAVMAQAAARAFPDKFRMLGGTFKDPNVGRACGD